MLGTKYQPSGPFLSVSPSPFGILSHPVLSLNRTSPWPPIAVATSLLTLVSIENRLNGLDQFVVNKIVRPIKTDKITCVG